MVFLTGAILGFILNFVSLYFPSRKTKGGPKKLLGNPGFVIGDFILIPLFFGLSAIFLKDNFMALSWPLLIFAFPVVLVYGKQFNLLKKDWVFHGLVAMFLVAILLLSLKFPPWAILFALILLINQLLGVVYPKKI
ncbi:hypothetical protein A2872_01095 [Candidatus Gottesmanbacteria bacterium RIFCSPHIGHO2_01_FULL_42_12]|uniref:Uncharacterized protein n=1 Tax=Candidatus Gottesmanbacteria bacterium RIFCSPHIGHO2_01_FULL_42_12 TaxID=1798377 RepID=A0A1F5Z2X6_9BACT|nr:MAG: hypothetical protein A2872_01095 [Candidatus Gottesmanbacteria bacterium RIFCSPHIGHO2_01_FULL_42_12]